MSRFKDIDIRLEELSEKLNAVLSKDRPGYPRGFVNFEERRIDWIDNGIRKAIIIQPTFESKGVDSTIWNFINIAWVDDLTFPGRPQWKKILLDKEKFEIILDNIDRLLKDSEANLTKITFNDLC